MDDYEDGSNTKQGTSEGEGEIYTNGGMKNLRD
jgi:hypothetical protein